MILVRAPLRISLAGGGTDLPAYYREHGPGAVVSMAIDKYVYLAVNPKLDGRVRVSYSRTENVETAGELQHELARECLRVVGVQRGVEVVSVADVPSGTGLGSSGAYAVGLLHALHQYIGHEAGPAELAEQACDVEMRVLGRPCGRQDQYMAAYGGVRLLRFWREDDVTGCAGVRVEDLGVANAASFQERLLLFWTGTTRPSDTILAEQQNGTADHLAELRQMVAQADALAMGLRIGQSLSGLGRFLDRGWFLKRQLAPGITTPEIDHLYERARAAGAEGGKLLGAGGGGFLLLCVPSQAQAMVRAALAPLRDVPWRVEPEGSMVVYADVR